jgi:hypothetical protein
MCSHSESTLKKQLEKEKRSPVGTGKHSTSKSALNSEKELEALRKEVTVRSFTHGSSICISFIYGLGS